MTYDELAIALRAHRMWLNNKNGGPVFDLQAARLVCNDAALRGKGMKYAAMAEANLSGAILDEAILDHACLARADLRGAKLVGTSLFRTDFSFADLAGADLTDADVRHTAWTGANLAGVLGLPDVPAIPNLHQKVADAVGQDGENLYMADWHHPCGTRHCRAGWAITFAGSAGKRLYTTFGGSTAGALIYFKSTGTVPDFYADDDVALEDIRKCAE